MDKKRLSLFVFIDALGWELLQQHSFLDDLLTTKAPLDTIFGYSSSCDPTFLTGKLPREHGHFTFFYYNPAESPFGVCRFLDVLPRFLTRRGRVRRNLSRAIQRYYGYTGYFQIYNMPFRYLPLFDYSEKRDIFQPGGINSGAPTLFDDLRAKGIPFYMSDWHREDEDRLKSAEVALEGGAVGFAYLFLGALDGVLHAHGTRSSAVEEKLGWYDRRLRQVIGRARKGYDEVRVSIFSDHGMTDVTDTCDLIAQVERLGLRFGVDYAAVYDSTMARFWFLKGSVREQIVGVLEAEGRGQILSEERLVGYGCDFADRRYGELFYLMDPGVLICPSFMGETPIAGMHGYAPEHRYSTASFMTNVTPPPVPRRLDDLYGLMRSEAGVEGGEARSEGWEAAVSLA